MPTLNAIIIKHHLHQHFHCQELIGALVVIISIISSSMNSQCHNYHHCHLFINIIFLTTMTTSWPCTCGHWWRHIALFHGTQQLDVLTSLDHLDRQTDEPNQSPTCRLSDSHSAVGQLRNLATTQTIPYNIEEEEQSPKLSLRHPWAWSVRNSS